MICIKWGSSLCAHFCLCFLSCMWPSMPEQRILQSPSALRLPFRFPRFSMWRGDSRTRVSSSWSCYCSASPSRLPSEKNKQCRERKFIKRGAATSCSEATNGVSCPLLQGRAIITFINKKAEKQMRWFESRFQRQGDKEREWRHTKLRKTLVPIYPMESDRSSSIGFPWPKYDPGAQQLFLDLCISFISSHCPQYYSEGKSTCTMSVDRIIELGTIFVYLSYA